MYFVVWIIEEKTLISVHRKICKLIFLRINFFYIVYSISIVSGFTVFFHGWSEVFYFENQAYPQYNLWSPLLVPRISHGAASRSRNANIGYDGNRLVTDCRCNMRKINSQHNQTSQKAFANNCWCTNNTHQWVDNVPCQCMQRRCRKNLLHSNCVFSLQCMLSWNGCKVSAFVGFCCVFFFLKGKKNSCSDRTPFTSLLAMFVIFPCFDRIGWPNIQWYYWSPGKWIKDSSQ